LEKLEEDGLVGRDGGGDEQRFRASVSLGG
jgi:hypothetical protein